MQYGQDVHIIILRHHIPNCKNKKITRSIILQVVKTFKVETKKFHKSIARRKAWKKFGLAENDPPGPNPANTIISEEIYMQFVHSKDAVSA